MTANQFFRSTRGRNLATGFVAVASGLAISASFVPHTNGLDIYEDNMHLYKNGEKVSLSPVLKQRFDKCLDILKLDDFHKRFQRPFTVIGFDVFNAGNWDTRKGTRIGIPSNYEYETEYDVDKDNILVGLKPVNWDLPAAKELAKSLVLPERLQIFGICKAILSTQNYQLYLNSIYGPAIIVLAYNASRYTNDKFKLFDRPKIIRFIFYGLYTAFGLGMYFFLKDLTQLSMESDVDKKLCDKGPEFAKDGVEFYDKILKRNIALRELMGKDGESLYSGVGNDLFYFRQKTTPLTERKKFFENKLKEYEAKS